MIPGILLVCIEAFACVTVRRMSKDTSDESKRAIDTASLGYARFITQAIVKTALTTVNRTWAGSKGAMVAVSQAAYAAVMVMVIPVQQPCALGRFLCCWLMVSAIDSLRLGRRLSCTRGREL